MNMRKIIAVLAAALMLCTIIPMGAVSVSAAADNLFPNGGFETGAADGWDLSWMGTKVKAEAAHTGSYGLRVNTNGSWNGTGNVVVEGLTVGKTYSFSLWYKSDGVAWINTTLKGNNDGAAQIGTLYLRNDVTEWTKLEETFVATDSAVKLNFAGGGSSGAADAAKTGVVYVDDIELICLSSDVENLFPNGDFATTDKNGWDYSWYGTKISADAAYEGAYGLEIVTNGTWNGSGNITVSGLEIGTTYVFSFMGKAASAPINYGAYNANGTQDNKIIAGSVNKGGDWQKYSGTFTAVTDSLYLKFNGYGNGTANPDYAGSFYVDNIMLTEYVPNLFPNGDFATTDKNGWDYSWYGTKISADAAYEGAYGLEIVTNGTWNGSGNITVSGLEIGATYNFSFMGKAASAPINYGAYNANGTQDNKIIAGSVNKGGDWQKYSGTFTAVTDSLYLKFNGYGNGTANPDYAGSFYVDNIMLTLVSPPAHVCDVVEQERVEADCTNDGYIKYACDCGLGEYTETIPALGHTPGAEADCDSAQVCTVCGAELNAALGHSWTDATCTAPKTCGTCGATEGEALGHSWKDADCTAPKTCGTCGATEGEALGHSYYSEFDVDCNECGAIRQVEIEAAIIHGGNSAMDMAEGTSGLAFLFSLNASDVEKWEHTQNTYLSETGTIVIDGVEYVLHSAGAVVSNKTDIAAEDLTIAAAQQGDKRIVNVGLKYLWDMEENYISYAIRVTNIPAAGWDTLVSARPYYTYINAEGDTVTIYGNMVTSTVNEAIN